MRLLALLLVVAVPANAEPLDPEKWRELTKGRTVVYAEDGEVLGEEYYLPGEGDRIRFKTEGGTCIEGTWRFEDGYFCYDWEQDEADTCVLQRIEGEQVEVLYFDEEGQPLGVQSVSAIEDRTIACASEIKW